MPFFLIFIGFLAGFMSVSVGFGGDIILLPAITSVYGVEVAVSICTVAQVLSNLSRVIIGFSAIAWHTAFQFLCLAVPLTALGAIGFAIVSKVLMTRILCLFLILFALMKIAGKLHLLATRTTMLLGGGLTGLINGLFGVSGPLSSAVFLNCRISFGSLHCNRSYHSHGDASD